MKRRSAFRGEKRSSLRHARPYCSMPRRVPPCSGHYIAGQWAIETKPSIALHVIFHCPTRRGRRGVAASRSQHRCHRKYCNRWWADIPRSRLASFHGSLVLYPILIRMENFFPRKHVLDTFHWESGFLFFIRFVTKSNCRKTN